MPDALSATGTGDNIQVRFGYDRPHGNGWNYTCEVSADLVDWQPAPPLTVTEVVEVIGDGTESVELLIEHASPQPLFLRILADRPGSI